MTIRQSFVRFMRAQEAIAQYLEVHGYNSIVPKELLDDLKKTKFQYDQDKALMEHGEPTTDDT